MTSRSRRGRIPRSMRENPFSEIYTSGVIEKFDILDPFFYKFTSKRFVKKELVKVAEASKGKAEMDELLGAELEKLFGQKPDWWFTKLVSNTIDIEIGLKKPRRYDTNQKRESWQKRFGEGIGIAKGARFECVIDECRGLISAQFRWDIAEVKNADRCVAAIKDFVAGIEAGKNVDVDKAINDARLSAALKAAVLSDKRTGREDRGDLL